MMKEYQKKYLDYIKEHKDNVYKGYRWLTYNLPAWLLDHNGVAGVEELIRDHDKSKYSDAEFDPYAYYFNVSMTEPLAVANFKMAWLNHIHCNPHHWQYWVLINDEDGTEALPMPERYMIEMVCDWWAFSWKSGNLFEIFNWYEKHKEGIMLNPNSRAYVEELLGVMKKKLTRMKELNLPLDNLADD